MARKLLYNGYKDKNKRYCIYCGRPYAERHEVYGGSNRQISIREGFQIDLCSEHHREIQDNITPWAQEQNAYWRSTMEAEWIQKKCDQGMTEREAVRQWMRLIGKNYCDDIQPE